MLQIPFWTRMNIDEARGAFSRPCVHCCVLYSLVFTTCAICQNGRELRTLMELPAPRDDPGPLPGYGVLPIPQQGAQFYDAPAPAPPTGYAALIQPPYGQSPPGYVPPPVAQPQEPPGYAAPPVAGDAAFQLPHAYATPGNYDGMAPAAPGYVGPGHALPPPPPPAYFMPPS